MKSKRSITAPAKKSTAAPAKKGSLVKEPQVAYATRPSRALELIGGRSIGISITDVKQEQDFIALIKKGLPRKAIDHLMMATGLEAQEIASIMHTSDRTLRRYKPSKLLNPEQSERVIELARLYSRGEEVFEHLDGFREWMHSTVLSLGNKQPKEFLDTSLGIELLLDELGRIEHGVFG
jgi:putative toxin-antitoxin system antitoxin component (TIGR02293 family)